MAGLKGGTAGQEKSTLIELARTILVNVYCSISSGKIAIHAVVYGVPTSKVMDNPVLELSRTKKESLIA